MGILKIKNSEREKFRILQNKSTLLQKENVKKNVEIYLNDLNIKNHKKNKIGIYWPINNEVDLTNLKKKYSIALPKCERDKNLSFYLWDKNPLVNDFEGIPAPDNLYLLNYEQIFVILVPCLSVDKNFIRLGYGGGYYDKLRMNEKWKSVPCIGILTSNCVSQKLLPRGEWDIPLSGFITDKKILV